MVELDPQCSASITDRNGLIQSVVVGTEVVEDVEGFARGESEFGMIAFALEFGDDDERDDDVVFGEAQKCSGIRQQHRGVENVGVDFFSHEDL